MKNMSFMGNSFVSTDHLEAQRRLMNGWFSEEGAVTPAPEQPVVVFTPGKLSRIDQALDLGAWVGGALYALAVLLYGLGLLG